MSLQRIAGAIGAQHKADRALDEAREALIELFDLLEEYGPVWYTEVHRDRALAAIKALEES